MVCAVDFENSKRAKLKQVKGAMLHIECVACCKYKQRMTEFAEAMTWVLREVFGMGMIGMHGFRMTEKHNSCLMR